MKMILNWLYSQAFKFPALRPPGLYDRRYSVIFSLSVTSPTVAASTGSFRLQLIQLSVFLPLPPSLPCPPPLPPPPPPGQVNPRGPELLGQLQEHDPRAVHRAWGAEGAHGAAQ